jgi:hypothetical protein
MKKYYSNYLILGAIFLLAVIAIFFIMKNVKENFIDEPIKNIKYSISGVEKYSNDSKKYKVVLVINKTHKNKKNNNYFSPFFQLFTSSNYKSWVNKNTANKKFNIQFEKLDYEGFQKNYDVQFPTDKATSICAFVDDKYVGDLYVFDDMTRRTFPEETLKNKLLNYVFGNIYSFCKKYAAL